MLQCIYIAIICVWVRKTKTYYYKIALYNLIWFEYCNLIGWYAWRQFWLYLITWVGIVTSSTYYYKISFYVLRICLSGLYVFCPKCFCDRGRLQLYITNHCWSWTRSQVRLSLRSSNLIKGCKRLLPLSTTLLYLFVAKVFREYHLPVVKKSLV